MVVPCAVRRTQPITIIRDPADLLFDQVAEGGFMHWNHHLFLTRLLLLLVALLHKILYQHLAYSFIRRSLASDDVRQLYSYTRQRMSQWNVTQLLEFAPSCVLLLDNTIEVVLALRSIIEEKQILVVKADALEMALR